MDFLNFRDVSVLPNSSIGPLCVDLNNILGQGVWYDIFQVQNKVVMALNDIVTTINSDKVLCGSFGLYQSYVAGILNSVKEIHFYVLCSEKLNYGDCVEKCIDGKIAVLLIGYIQIISAYHLVVRQLHYRLKKDNFQNYHRTNIRAKCVKNALIVTSLRHCVHQQERDVHN